MLYISPYINFSLAEHMFVLADTNNFNI